MHVKSTTELPLKSRKLTKGGVLLPNWNKQTIRAKAIKLKHPSQLYYQLVTAQIKVSNLSCLLL
jgi:hypothetical protein